VAKSKFSAKKTRPKRKRTPRPRPGGRGDAWRAYVGAGRGGGAYTPSSEPIPD
jgi:hypothetical protein